MAGCRGLTLSTIISLFLTASVAAQQRETSVSSWGVTAPIDAEAYQVDVLTNHIGDKFQKFSFIFSSDENSTMGRISASNQNYAEMQRVSIPEHECYLSNFFEHFERTLTRYLMCFENDRLLLMRLSNDAPDFMPKFLEMVR